MQSLHRAFRAGLRRETLVFFGISRVPTGCRFGGWEAHVPQNDHNLAGLQVRCRGAERMSRIACFSSWDHAGRRSRRGRREFGPSRPSPWSVCPWDRVRRETPTILAGRIDRHIVPADLPPRVQRAQAGFLIAEEIPFLRGHLPGARSGSAGRGRWNRTGLVVWSHWGFSPPIGSGTRRMRTYTPSGRVSPFLRRP